MKKILFKTFYVHIISLVFVFLLFKILDFGLARHAEVEMTGYVATRWYRAPEIMLNWMHYNQTGELFACLILCKILLNMQILSINKLSS